MRCPAGCDAVLVLSERSGIEIDYCPECRGVWLDRGELDKMIERATPVPAAVSAPTPPDPRWGERYDDRYQDNGHAPRPKKKKKSGFLENLFDFEGG